MKKLKYTFKFYYKDGTEEILDSINCTKPELLYNDFDGLMNQYEFRKLHEKELTTHEILEIAYKVYRKLPSIKDYYRIEIICLTNGEVIDCIENNSTPVDILSKKEIESNIDNIMQVIIKGD